MNQHLRKKMLIATFLNLNFKNANQKINSFSNNRILNILSCVILTTTIITANVSATTPTLPEDRIIKGVVLDQKGETLIGVNIKEKGSTNLTVTDNDGKFILKLKSLKRVLIVSYIGFTSQEVIVGDKSFLEITLKDENKDIDELVVIGYQSVTRRDVQGSVSSIQMKDVKGITSPSVDAMLQGMIPGLNIQINSGQPGGRNTFNIRGNTSTNAGEMSTPLFVLDGVPVDPDVVGYSTTATNFLTNINPADIESIDVLKDAASASIYGSRAANGVVLIKTKKGQSGTPKISVNQKFAVASLPILPKVYTGAAERAMRLKMLGVSSTYERASEMPLILTDSLNSAFNNNTDWYGLFYRPAITQDYNLSISGGTEAMNYRTSAGYYKQDGTLKGTGFNRFSFSNNMTNRIGRKLTFNTNVGLTLGSTQAPVDNAVSDAVNTGNPMPSSLLYLNDADRKRYLGNYTSMRNENSDMQIRLSELITFNITDWLLFNSTSSCNINVSKLDRFSPASISSIARSYAYSRVNKNVTSNYENFLNFNKTFNVHRISAVLGTAFSQTKNHYTSADGAYFPTDLVQTVSGAPQQYKDGYSDLWESGLFGVFSRAQYFYKDRYSIYASIRRDGSSKLSPSHRYGNFPAFGAFWTISDEPFMKSIANAISFFKLRSSYGQSGNQPGGNAYGYNSRYVVAGTSGGSSAITPEFGDGAAQKDLSWEATKEINLGLDLELLRGRFFFSADWYNKDIDGLFFSLEMPNTSGYDRYNTNSVGVRNRGYELMLKANMLPTTLKDWNWSVRITASHNNNMITALPNGNKTIVDGGRVLTVGHPINQFYLAIYDGVYATDDEVPFNPFTGQKYQSEGGAIYKAGDAKLRDIDGNYKWYSYMDKTAAGDPNPKWIGGLFSSLNWRDLTLDVRCSFTIGRDVYNQALERSLTSMVSGGGSANGGTTFSGLKDYISTRMLLDVSNLNYWQKSGDNANYPNLSPYRNVANYPGGTTMFLENGSYLKMNSIMLSYRVPNVKKIGIDNLRFSLTAENLFVISAKGSNIPDPENVGYNGYYSGNGYGLSRLFTFGLQLEF